MSDLQDIIVTSSVKAFNSGLAHGVIQERERIMKVLEEIKVINADQKYFVAQAIKGEQK